MPTVRRGSLPSRAFRRAGVKTTMRLMGATRRGAILAALGALAAGAAVVALTRRGADEGDPVAAAAPRSVEELRAAVIATETTSVPSDRAPVADAEGPRAAPTARLEPVVLARVFDASRRPIAGVHAMVIAFLRASRYVDSLDGLVAIEKDWVRQFGVRLEPANAGLFPFRASPSAMGFHDALVTLASTVPVRRSPDPAVPDALILDVVERQWSVVTRADGCVALDSPLPDAWFGIRVTAGLVDERYSGDAEAPAAVKVDGETSARGGLALVLPDPPGNARVSFRVIEEGTGSPVRQATIELERPAVLVSQGTSGDLLFA
ncbi:MAG TPA: hypothetical protein VKE69_07165, partial [Planctomycetota bacterium]|nr:hypothetical protein [Planctomycetota bacterium]